MWETYRGRGHLRDLSAYDKIILKCILILEWTGIILS